VQTRGRGGSSDTDVTLFGAKNLGIYGVSAQTRKEPVRTGGEAQFCADVFYGRPLIFFFWSRMWCIAISIFVFIIFYCIRVLNDLFCWRLFLWHRTIR